MTFVTTCTCVLALVSVATAKIVWNPLPTPRGDDRHNITFSRWAIYEPKYNPTAKVWDGNQIGTQYQTLQRSGNHFGAYLSKSGAQLTINGQTSSNYPDFSSLLNLGIEDGTNNVLYSVTHFESGYPSSVYLTKINQNKTDGALSVVENSVVDFSRYNGVINPCAGSVTPWMTHLGSEENDPDARLYAPEKVSTWKTSPVVMAYLQYMDMDVSVPARIYDCVVLDFWKPYKYGLIWEAVVSTEGVATATKMFTMGRSSAELAFVMPDKKTTYISVDSGYKPFLKFVADVEGDLSAGCLATAQLVQTSGPTVQGGSFTITWVPMGCSSNDVLEPMSDTLLFTDIFEYMAPVSNACDTGYKLVYSSSGTLECLMLKPNMEIAAAFFETIRYSSYIGGTNEWNKFEGLTYDKKRNVLYAAVTAVERGMLDIVVGNMPNNIRIPANPCGCVYKIALTTGYEATAVSPLVCGIPNPAYTAPSPNPPVPGSADDLDLNKNNMCSLDSIASPDNLGYVEGHDALLIGEDTTGHQNDVLWYYDFNPPMKRGVPTIPLLSRMLTGPLGSEITNNQYYSDINGFAYFTVVIQHPYGESDYARVTDARSAGRDGYVGYIGHNIAYEYYKDYSPTTPGLYRYGALCTPGAFSYVGCDDKNKCTADDCTVFPPDVNWYCTNTPIELCCNTLADCPERSAPVCYTGAQMCVKNKCVFAKGPGFSACLKANPPPVEQTKGLIDA